MDKKVNVIPHEKQQPSNPVDESAVPICCSEVKQLSKPWEKYTNGESPINSTASKVKQQFKPLEKCKDTVSSEDGPNQLTKPAEKSDNCDFPARFNYFFNFRGFLNRSPANEFNKLEFHDLEHWIDRLKRFDENIAKKYLKNTDFTDTLRNQSKIYNKKLAGTMETNSQIDKDLLEMSAGSSIFAKILTGPNGGRSLQALEQAVTGDDLKAGMSAVPSEVQEQAKVIHQNMMNYKEHGGWWKTQIGFLESSQSLTVVSKSIFFRT